MPFEPTRTAGLTRLDAFTPLAGDAYQQGRNFDLSTSAQSVVSQLSPWLRHRLVAEWEVLETVTRTHSPKQAMAYIQEIFWRGYFKGWLEHRPSVWAHYVVEVANQRRNLPEGYFDAIGANTGIDCFDHWCNELRQTGYLHNHARMWFASIWIFTLRLPWELGAEFFLDTLVDADPASNTLSWRWVAGLHTKGKNYLATAENIARFTDGRYCPTGQLNEAAPPIEETLEHAPRPTPVRQMPVLHAPLRLITEEDCHPSLETTGEIAGVLGVVSPEASSFAQQAVRATAGQLGGETYVGHNWSNAIAHAAERHGTREVITSYIPTGHVQDGLNKARATLASHGITLHEVIRPYDALVWPHTTKGFFKLKKQIPAILGQFPL